MKVKELGSKVLNVLKFVPRVIGEVTSLIMLAILGGIHKAVNHFSPEKAKKIKKFIHLFYRNGSVPKKSFYVIMLPALALILGLSTVVITATASPQPNAKEIVKTEKVAEGKDKDSVPTKEQAVEAFQLTEEEKFLADKTVDDVVIPDDYRGAFIKKMLPTAIEMGKKYEVYPSVIMAQAIIESDWGRSTLAANYNNYFGVKARKDANGNFIQEYVDLPTIEEYDGQQVWITDAFAVYPDATGSLEHNASLIRNGNGDPYFYSGTWRENAPTYRDAAHNLTHKYATDSGYGDKLIGLIQTYGLNFADK